VILTVGQVLEESVRALLEAGVEEPRLDARLLAAFALRRTPEQIFAHPEAELDPDQEKLVRALIARRVAREPLALITGEKEFWSLRFKVSSATLIPRPDSETLIEAVLDAVSEKESSLRILDLGTGSGCLLLALLHEFGEASGIGVDVSEQALRVASVNAENLALSNRARFIQADWNEAMVLGGSFDLVVCNPPYVPALGIESLQPEVTEFEPHSALFAGSEGFAEFPKVIALLPELLNDGGSAFFEVGIGQSDAVAMMLRQTGLRTVNVHPDLAGIGRCVSGMI